MSFGRLGMLGAGFGRLGHGSRTPWTPEDLGASLIAWWDADAGVVQTDGAVSQWIDGVGALTLAQATADNQPVYSATSFNGRPGVTFDGTADFLNVEAVTGLPTGADPCEMWALVDQTALAADATNRYLFNYGGAVSTVRRALLRRVVSGVNRAAIEVGNGSSGVLATDTSVNLSGRCVIRGVASGTLGIISVNGGSSSQTAVVPATTSVRTRMGCSTAASPNSFWQGTVAAVLVTAPLTDNEAALLADYLARRAD
jgi:hypothetical protein